MQKTVAIVGGGASGIFCAVNIANLCPNLKVIVLEKSNKLLAKVKISVGVDVTLPIAVIIFRAWLIATHVAGN